MAVCELDLSSWFIMIGHWMTLSTGIVGKGAPMANDLEKRSFTRHITQGVITLHTSLMTPHVINAHLLNCSKEGICFTSTKKFSTGTTMLYRSLYNNYSITGENEICLLGSIGMMTVKWCHENSSDDHPVYISGATYMTSA